MDVLRHWSAWLTTGATARGVIFRLFGFLVPDTARYSKQFAVLTRQPYRGTAGSFYGGLPNPLYTYYSAYITSYKLSV